MERFFWVSRVCIVALMCVLFFGVGIKSEAAAPGKVTGVKQVNDSASAVSLSWNAVQGADGYKIEYCESNSFTGSTYNYGYKENTSVTIPGLGAGKTYYVRVSALIINENNEEEVGTPSSVVDMVTAPSAKVTSLKQKDAKEKSASFTWGQAAGANAYVLLYHNVKVNPNNAKEKILGNVKTCSLSLPANSIYYIYVYPARKSSSNYVAVGNGGMKNYVTVLPGKVSKVKLLQTGTSNNSQAKTVEFSWNPNAVASGYEYTIYGYNNKKIVTKTTKSNAGVKISHKKLTNDQFMKIRVRAYVTVNGKKKYGKWSDDLWFAKYPKGIKASMDSSGIKLKWGKVKGAKNYTIYASTNAKSGFKKVGTTTKTSLTIKKIKGKKVAVGKQYYVSIVPNKKVGKKTFTGDKRWMTNIRFTYR